MKVVFEFYLPEDQVELNLHNSTSRMHSFILDFQEELRCWRKYKGEEVSGMNGLDMVNKLSDVFHALLNDHKIITS